MISGEVFPRLGGGRYCGDKNAMSSKVCRGGEGSRTEYESLGLCVLVGGGSRSYYGERAHATENFSAQARKARAFVVRLAWMVLRLEGRETVRKGWRRERIFLCWSIYLWGCWAGSWVSPGRYLEKVTTGIR